VCVAACDATVFDIADRETPADAQVRAAADASADAKTAESSASSDKPADADGGRAGAAAAIDASPPKETGGNSVPDASLDAAVGGGSASDAAAAGNGSSATAGSGSAAGNGSAGADQGGRGGPDAEPLQTPSCPTRSPEPGTSFCYDFEQGIKGPDGGDAFFLWETPGNPTPSALTTQEQPVGSGDHVLFASPPLTGGYPSSTIGHDTLRFSRALAEFDFWANPTLLNVDKDVVFFRYLPDENDFEHVTQLIFRRGEAHLRMEDGSGKNHTLARAPSPTDKTHVSVLLDRSSTCQVHVYFDDSLMVSSDPVRCAADGQKGFVEYGLVILDGSRETLSALYDNIALGVAE
jgi:hypothetical protein